MTSLATYTKLGVEHVTFSTHDLTNHARYFPVFSNQGPVVFLVVAPRLTNIATTASNQKAIGLCPFVEAEILEEQAT